jgi:hypothetical protein
MGPLGIEPIAVGWESVIVKLGMVAIAAILLYLLVKAYGRGRAKMGAGEEHEKVHEANDAARKRFDWATRRTLSANAKNVVARMRARAERAGLLRPPSDD